MVDVLVVAHNGRELLRACLTSIDRHRPPAETAVVRISVFDNASDDGVSDLVAESFPDVRLIHSPVNLGFARANNILAATTTADYVMLLNSDTEFVEDVVGPLLTTLRSDPRIVVAAPRLEFPDGTPQYSSERFPTLRYELANALYGSRLFSMLRGPLGFDTVLERTRRTDEIEARRVHDADFVWATCWLLRRADVGPDGPFDERYFVYDEDLDFCRRARAQGRRIVWVGSTTLVHIGGASSTSASKTKLTRATRRHYYHEHRGLAAATTYAGITASVDWARAAFRRVRSG